MAQKLGAVAGFDYKREDFSGEAMKTTQGVFLSLQRRGQYAPPPGASNILGLEASGHVAELGPGCQGHWKPGDSAMALLPGGGQAQYVTVPEGLLMPIPEGLSLSQAAAIPEAWLTAFQLLYLLGAGVNLILDCIGGSYWEKNVNCLALDGRWILYGLMGGDDISGPLLSKLLFKRGSLITSLLRSRDKMYKQTLVKTFTEQVLPHFSSEASQCLLPVLDRVYPVTEIQEAHVHMEANRNMGKIVLTLPR
ncbi:quinone oxidoreductase PIG3 [Echinops telfairi]|uniref:Quinone oxidoreductase PIG3 n=1 Tax=Echinops telfairi TaxID=9371 RepID=A0AC55CSR6_ECHTE|nr:quinone oxidoreductase PIG3 [Echinops telfairi]